MAREPKYMGCQSAVKTVRNALEVTKRESGRESIHQHLLRLKAKEKTMGKQEVGSHE